jgi:hypothetical protein
MLIEHAVRDDWGTANKIAAYISKGACLSIRSVSASRQHRIFAFASLSTAI